MASSISNVIAEYLLADNRNKNKKAIKNVNYFIEYIKKDKEIFIRDLGEYEPVMLDATIYIPSKIKAGVQQVHLRKPGLTLLLQL